MKPPCFRAGAAAHQHIATIQWQRSYCKTPQHQKPCAVHLSWDFKTVLLHYQKKTLLYEVFSSGLENKYSESLWQRWHWGAFFANLKNHRCRIWGGRNDLECVSAAKRETRGIGISALNEEQNSVLKEDKVKKAADFWLWLQSGLARRLAKRVSNGRRTRAIASWHNGQ